MYADERSLRLTLYNEERGGWLTAKKELMCSHQVRFAHSSHRIAFDSADIKGKSFWVAHVDVEIPKSKSPMYWYFTLNDCALEQSYHPIRDAPEMEYTLIVKDGDSHLSADERGMNKLHLFQIILSSALLLWVAVKAGQATKLKSGQIHIALIALAFALMCDIFSCGSEMIHSSVYEMNGVGSYSIDCLATHFEAQCDAIVALVLLTVGAGWTLPSDVLVSGKQNAAMMETHSWVQKTVAGFRSPVEAMHQLKNGNPAAVLVLFILFLHAGLAQWGRTFDDEFDSYHSLDNTPGLVLVWFRVILGLIFLASSSSVRNNGRCPSSLQPFLQKFQVLGMSWFISLSVVAALVSSAMQSHQKHFALALAVTLVQSSSLASLVWLFTASKDASPYHRVSNLQTENGTLSSETLSSTSGGSPKSWKIGRTKIRID
ncbi:unnamed protein product [Heterosigma akashiwo]